MLVIDCCVRGDTSTTCRYYQAYLQKYAPQNVTVLELSKQNLAPVDAAYLQQRDALRYAGEFSNAFFDLARQFRDADEILIAAPYWDLSFPALLKVYLAYVAVCDLTFGYNAEGQAEGYCRAKQLLYFSSCGGYVGEQHLGYDYIRAFADMLGIYDCKAYTLEGMDIDPSKREELLAEAIARL